MADQSLLDLIDAIDDVLATTVDFVRPLAEADASRPTDCPGWTVRDQLAHMVGLEQVLGGLPEPDIDLPSFDHVTSDIDKYMERHVHIRRQLPLVAIADEMAGMRPRRIVQLRELAATGDPLVKGPFGDRPLSASLPIRVFDLWAHEQDIRRAVGSTPRVEGAAANLAVAQSLRGWGESLPKKVGELTGQLVVKVANGTMTNIMFGNGGPTATLSGNAAEIVWLACGRGSPGDSAFDGDTDVIAAVRPHLGFTP